MSDDGPARVEGTLAIAAALTAAAGFVDAHVFLHVAPVFVANQSGNVVLLGIGLGEGRAAAAAAHAASIVLFAVGVAVGTVIHERRRAAGLTLRPDLLLAAEAAMVTALLAVLVVTGTTDSATVEGRDYPVIVLGALAMGLQTVVVGRVGSVAVATTYESGAVARVGEESAHAGRARAPEDRRRHGWVVVVLGAIVASYAAGAAGAAAATSSPAWLLVPLAVLVASALVARRVLVTRP